MSVQLIHFVADDGEDEYLALLEEEEIEEHRVDGYSVHGKFYVIPQDPREDKTHLLPLERTFEEW